MNTFEKNKFSDEIDNEVSSWEKSLNTHSNALTSKPSTEITKSSNKDISYIFKLDATRRQLEKILKDIDKLDKEFVKKENEVNEKYREYVFLSEQLYTLDLEYKELSITFDQNLRFYNIKNSKIILDFQKRDRFLNRFANDVKKKLLDDNPAKRDQKERRNHIQEVAQQEKEKMRETINALYATYLNTDIKKKVLDKKNKETAAAKKALADQKDKLTECQDSLNKALKEYDDVNKNGLLKSYEVSGAKIPINDFVASPIRELQMKKLIAIFNNQSEAKKFWLSKSKGILFVGEPETGKTFAAKMFASEVDLKMYHIKAHDLFSEDIADPNEMLYVIFYNIIDNVRQTKESCIIFLDEIEKIITSMWEYNPATEKMILNTIIKNIINIHKSNLDIVIIAAVSQKNRIDERLMKYDIFDSQFFFELPKENERKRFFQMYIQKAEKRAKMKLFNVDTLDELVKKSGGFSAEYIKQLISSCVKEYLYAYIQKKNSFIIKQNFISSKINDIAKWISEKRLKSPLELSQRKKILKTFIDQYTMKSLVFWELTGDKKSTLLDYILKRTNFFTESELTTLMQDCFDEYQRRKSDYQEKNLINKDFILDKIEELRYEEKIKWKSPYLSNT